MLIINISLLGCWTFLFLLCLNLPLCLSLLWESTKVRQAAGAGIYSLNPVMDYTALVLSNFTHTTHWFGYCGLFWQYCGSAVRLTECRHFDRLIKPPMFLCLHTFKRDKSDLSRLAFSFVISHHKMPSGCGSFCSVLFPSHLNTIASLHCLPQPISSQMPTGPSLRLQQRCSTKPVWKASLLLAWKRLPLWMEASLTCLVRGLPMSHGPRGPGQTSVPHHQACVEVMKSGTSAHVVCVCSLFTLCYCKSRLDLHELECSQSCPAVVTEN